MAKVRRASKTSSAFQEITGITKSMGPQTPVYIYIWSGGSVGSIVGGVSGPTFVLFLFYVSVSGMHFVSLVLPGLDDAGSLGSPPRQVVYPPGSMVRHE